MSNSRSTWLVAALATVTICAIALAIWLTRDATDVSGRIQAIMAVAAFVATACAAVFAALQLRWSAETAFHALATELPYLFIEPDVEVVEDFIVIKACNYGRTVCTAAVRSIEALPFLPHRQTWMDGTGGVPFMKTVQPQGHIEAAKIKPATSDRHILGRLEYVNVFHEVQISWYRFDLVDGEWVRRGGMHWNPTGMGRPRHHDDAEPNRLTGRRT